ncbi:DUF1353 domain-containing protein [Blastococcus sp. CT_GayMR16]|uniref:DUF1353 domain-containing protein n=1 Tax=Blastococcus sp. CT_GayMR16 TaxID=2559607 RepID=UPI0010745A33|nr:DUF1353 domain-containing protein [Blastococcus sp. CT_GayMR16]TFV91422.1 DUF1353 domain-containing protein [Blastococcus sp. CT_GayMR16]
MPFARGPVLTYTGRGRYSTVGPTEYVGDPGSGGDVITIPGGFTTDLASVPRLFWALIPPQGAYESAAVLHDYLCAQLAEQYAGTYRVDIDAWTPERGWPQRISARDTDGLFRRVMREAGVPFLIRWVMWVGVRWGALANPARRSGWWRDAPLVVFLSALGLAVTLLLLWAAHEAVDAFLRLITRGR